MCKTVAGTTVCHLFFCFIFCVCLLNFGLALPFIASLNWLILQLHWYFKLVINHVWKNETRKCVEFFFVWQDNHVCVRENGHVSIVCEVSNIRTKWLFLCDRRTYQPYEFDWAFTNTIRISNEIKPAKFHLDNRNSF